MGGLKGLFTGGPGLADAALFRPRFDANGRRVSIFDSGAPPEIAAPEAPEQPETLLGRASRYYDKAQEFLGGPKQAIDLGVGLGADYLKRRGVDLGIDTDRGNEAGQLLRKVNPMLAAEEAITQKATSYLPTQARDVVRGLHEGLLEKGSALATDPVMALLPSNRVAAAAFLPAIVRGAGEEAGAAIEAAGRGEYGEAAKHGAGAAVDTAFGLLGGAHAFRRPGLAEAARLSERGRAPEPVVPQPVAPVVEPAPGAGKGVDLSPDEVARVETAMAAPPPPVAPPPPPAEITADAIQGAMAGNIPAEPRLAPPPVGPPDRIAADRAEVGRIQDRVAAFDDAELLKRERFYRREGLQGAGDLVREEITRRQAPPPEAVVAEPPPQPAPEPTIAAPDVVPPVQPETLAPPPEPAPAPKGYGEILASLPPEARAAIEAEVYRVKTTDSLTGLKNKAGWEDITKAMGDDDHAAVVDLKGFKEVNDTYGHDAADEILRSVGGLMRRHFGEESARQGGDEFGAVLRGLSPEEAQGRVDAFNTDLKAVTHTLEGPNGERIDIPAVEAHLGLARGKEAARAADLAANAHRQQQGSGRRATDRPGVSDLGRPVEGAPPLPEPGLPDRSPELAPEPPTELVGEPQYATRKVESPDVSPKRGPGEKSPTEAPRTPEGERINPDALPREVLSRMSQNLKAQGYDIRRGADDVRQMLKSGRVFRDGQFTHEDWRSAYEAATGTRARRQEKAKTIAEQTPHVNWEAVRKLGTTSNPTAAGYIRPDGKLLDLSGAGRGSLDRHTRGEDHRIVGGHAGMTEFKAIGNIRWTPEANGFDISKEPTAEQYRTIRNLADRAHGDRMLVDLADGIGEYDEHGGYYGDPPRKTSLEYPEGTKPEKIIGDIRRFFAGENIESGTRYGTIPAEKPGVATSPEEAVLRAIREESPRAETMGALAYMPNVRAKANLPPEVFDEAVRSLREQGRIQTQAHPTPSQLTDAERAAMVPETTRGKYDRAVQQGKITRAQADSALATWAKSKPGGVDETEYHMAIGLLGRQKYATSKEGGLPTVTELRNRAMQVFKGQRMETHPEGLTIHTPSGRRIFIKPDRIEFSERAKKALESGHGKAAIEQLESGRRQIAGVTYNLGRDALIRLANDAVLEHEAVHVFENHFATPKEREFAQQHFGEQAKTEGRKYSEVFADAYKDWAHERRVAQGPIRSLFEKIKDFAYRASSLLGVQSKGGLFREIESGRVFDRTGENAEAPTERKFSSTQVGLPAHLAREVKVAAARISSADLAGNGRETDPHITVKFGIHDEKADAVRAALAGEGPITVKLGKTSLFPPSESSDGAAVVKVDVDSPDLHRLNEKIAKAVPTTDTHPEYKPHVTLAYVKPEAANKYVGNSSLAGRTATIDRITFSGKDGSTTEIPLTGSEPQYATAPASPPEAPERKAKPITPERKEEIKPLGRPMKPGEAPRVEKKVASLEEVSPEADLSRNAPRTWESLDPQIRKKLRTILVDPKEETALYERAKKGKVDDVDVQTLDALVAGKRESYDNVRQRLIEAQDEGRDTGPENVAYLRAALDRATSELALAARSDVEAGTKLARALAARARVMDAAGKSTPDQFLKRVFRQIPDVTDAQAADLLTIMKERPQDLGDALIAATQPSKFDRFLEAWKAGLVSAPGTQVANILGNVGEQIVRLGETATAAAIDPLLKGGGKTRLSGEARYEFAGAMKGASKSLARLSQDLRDALNLAPEKIDYDNLDRLPKIGGKKGRFARIPFRLLSAFDDFFKGIGGEAEIHKLAFREAKGDAVEAQRLIEEPTKEMLAQIATSRKERTFQDPNRAAEAIINLRSNQKWLHLVAPFVQTPSNIARVAWQRSPAGFYEGYKALTKYREALRNGTPEEIATAKGQALDKLARPLVGTAIMGTFYAIAKAGGLTGSGPTDPKDKNLLRDSGWQPYSVVIPVADGKRLYVPFNRFEPISSILGIAADAAEAGQAKTAGDLIDKGIGSIIENFTSKTYLQGITDAAEAISDPKQFASQYVSNIAGSLVPNIVAKVAQTVDPKVRETRAERAGVLGIPERVAKTLVSRIPGASLALSVRKGGTGQDIERPGVAITRLLSPVQPSFDKEDADIRRRLVELDAAPSAPRRDLTVHGQKIRLTDPEYDVLARANELAFQRVTSLLRSDRFNRLSDDEQKNEVEDIFNRYTRQARKRLYAVPDFRMRAAKARQAVLDQIRQRRQQQATA